MATPNLQIELGNFVDMEGTPLSGGYLLWELSHDERYSVSNSQIVAGLKIRITLDTNGNVPTNPPTLIYSNDTLTPTGSFYTVRAFKSDGTEAWKSAQYFQLNAAPDPLDLGTLVPVNPPGGLISGGSTSITLQTNSVNNTSQALLNFVDTASVTFSNPSGGVVSATAVSSFTPNSLPPIGTSFLYCDGTGVNPLGVAIEGIQSVGGPVNAHLAGAVAGEGSCISYDGSAGSSPNTDCSWKAGMDASFTSNARVTLLSARRFTFRQAMAAPTQYRYWVGVYTGTTALNDPTFATDTPNIGYVAFRFSHGTDTTWKAVAGTSNVAQTVVNTGVSFTAAPSTVFQIALNSTATSVGFYINGTSVATITTNLIGGNTGVALFGTGDNKSTGTSTPQITFCYAVVEYK